MNKWFEREMQLSGVDFSQVALSAVQQAKGVKTANASLNGGPVEFLISDEFLRAPFGASAFQDPTATRLTLELEVTSSPALPLLQAVDEWAIEYVSRNNILGSLTADEVARQYSSPLQVSERFPSTRIRTKVNTCGTFGCKFYLHPEKKRAHWTDLDSLRGAMIKPYIHFKGIWVQKASWGLILECKQLLVDQAGEVAPVF